MNLNINELKVYFDNEKGIKILDNGTINIEGIKIYYILASLGSHPVSYIVLPNDCFLLRLVRSFPSLSLRDLIDVHGDFTYHKPAGDFYLKDDIGDIPQDYDVLGWDYMHAGDFLYHPNSTFGEHDKKWTIPELKDDMHKTLNQLQSLYQNTYIK